MLKRIMARRSIQGFLAKLLRFAICELRIAARPVENAAIYNLLQGGTTHR
jgi:hypothetical protein